MTDLWGFRERSRQYLRSLVGGTKRLPESSCQVEIPVCDNPQFQLFTDCYGRIANYHIYVTDNLYCVRCRGRFLCIAKLHILREEAQRLGIDLI